MKVLIKKQSTKRFLRFILRQTGMRALLIFDEAEDILRDLNRDNTKETGSKAFINETLENFGVPVIFISNRTDLFDPATMRRILPIYHVNYMPYAARKKSIDKKVQSYLDITLNETEIDELAAKSEKLTIAVIDSCVRNVSKDISKAKRNDVLNNLDREIHRAIVAMNHGFLPLPYENDSLPNNFNPALISASCDTQLLYNQFTEATQISGACAGADILLLGKNGSGRKTLATYLASAFNKPIKVVPFNEGAAIQFPSIVHAGDLERADLDENILIFDGVTNFLPMAYRHPFMQRLRNHRFPSFLVGNDEPFGNELPQNLIQAFTFAIRTGNLSNEQRVTACRDMLGMDCTENDLSSVPSLNIGNIQTVKRQLDALGKNGETSMQEIIKFLEKLEATKKPIGHRPAGFS